MKAVLALGAILSLAVLPAAAQTASTPGALGGGQVGSGAAVLPSLRTTTTNPPTAPASGVTLSSTNPTGSANPDAATGAAATGAITGGANSGTPSSGGGGGAGGGGGGGARSATANSGLALATNNATPAAAGTGSSAAASGANGSAGRAGANAGAGSGAPASTTNNATAAASAGSGRRGETILCLPADASTTQPFLEGTDLSCAP